MTLRQTIQAAPGKATELIAKLSATSNQAVKTRETLFAQLNDELVRYVEVEEQHFLPLLRKHPQTKALAVDALKGNKELRASLETLATLPKDNDEFLAALAEMNKSFQQHVRDERKELLPAVLDALSDDEATALAATIEQAAVEAEKSKREEKREEAAQAKRQAEEAEQAAADAAKAKREEGAQAKREAEEAEQAAADAAKAKRAEQRKEAAQVKRQAEEAEEAAAAERAAQRAAVRAQKAAERSAREASEQAAETIGRGAASMQDSARQVTETMTKRMQQVASGAREAMAVYSSTAQTVVEDLQTVRASSAVSMGALSEVRSAWVDWFGKAARLNMEASQQLIRCRSVTQVAELQREYVTTAMHNWMEGRSKVLEIAQLTSKKALRPLDERLNEVA